MTLKATNESKENRTMTECMKTYSMHYTGVRYKDIKKDRQSHVVIPPGESKHILFFMMSLYPKISRI